MPRVVIEVILDIPNMVPFRARVASFRDRKSSETFNRRSKSYQTPPRPKPETANPTHPDGMGPLAEVDPVFLFGKSAKDCFKV